LVTGMTFASSHKPDIVCEPCLAGKMHSNPFPSSPLRSTKPLELVHSDLHGPLPVATREGYTLKWIIHLKPRLCAVLGSVRIMMCDCDV